MKRLVLACLPALLLALPSQAKADGCGIGFKLGLGVRLSFSCLDDCGGGCCPAQAGPWYLYWPYQAHFINPAPTGYPYWPAPMTLPPGGAYNGGYGPPAYQPVSFFPPGPSYWYGR